MTPHDVCFNCLHNRSSHDDSGRCLEIVYTGRGATGYVPCLCRGFKPSPARTFGEAARGAEAEIVARLNLKGESES